MKFWNQLFRAVRAEGEKASSPSDDSDSGYVNGNHVIHSIIGPDALEKHEDGVTPKFIRELERIYAEENPTKTVEATEAINKKDIEDMTPLDMLDGTVKSFETALNSLSSKVSEASKELRRSIAKRISEHNTNKQPVLRKEI